MSGEETVGRGGGKTLLKLPEFPLVEGPALIADLPPSPAPP